MDVRLDNKVALITGGSLGLGRAMALRFAEAGASVAIAARGKEALESTAAKIKKSLVMIKLLHTPVMLPMLQKFRTYTPMSSLN